MSKTVAQARKLRAYFFNGCGILLVVIGVIGLFLPLLPTTPFLILAAFCFKQGSEKFHVWLIEHKWLGPPVQDWQRGQVIRLQTKIIATLTMLAGGVGLFVYASAPDIVKGAYAIFIGCILIFIWTRASR
ncbi:MAG: YbaN family protein [Bacteriovoracia bacterium]